MKKLFCSIRFQLITFMLLIAVIPVILIMTWLLKMTTETIRHEVSFAQQNSLQYIQRLVDRALSDTNHIVTNLLYDTGLQKLMYEAGQSSERFQSYQDMRQIHAKLNSLKVSNANIDSIYLVDLMNRRAFSTEQSGYIPEAYYELFGWLDLQLLTMEKPGWYVVPKALTNSMRSADSEEYLISNRKHCVYKGADLFDCYINIDRKLIDDLLLEMQTSPHTMIFMTDESMELITSLQAEEGMFEAIGQELTAQAATGYFDFSHKGDKYFCAYTVSPETHWKLFSVLPKSEIDYAVGGVRQITFVIGALSVILILLFGVYVYILFYRPVKQLITIMNKNENGQLTLTGLHHSKNEFGQIGSHFNNMLLKMESLNTRIYKQELAAKNAEIKLLQSQINPHFLYNVLDTIHWMARMNKMDEVSRMTIALSKYYRKSLNEGRTFVTVTEAVELMFCYWDIMKIRFHEELDLETDIEEGIAGCCLPKRMLQPLIENAITHGYKSQGGSKLILVTGLDLGGDIKFIVEDNGAGIPPEKLANIQEQLRDPKASDPSENFALKNIHSQIRLAFGSGYGLTLESTFGEGTTVAVTLPKLFVDHDGER